ncbi:hypothetical protein D3C73_1506040 [compost metagenome]
MTAKRIRDDVCRRCLEDQLRADLFRALHAERRMRAAQPDQLLDIGDLILKRGTALPVDPVDLDRTLIAVLHAVLRPHELLAGM